MVSKGDIGAGVAVLGSSVGAAVSWAAGFGVFTILFSVIIGSLLTYFVGTRTQKNAWKRESALRKVEEIYGPLYSQLNRLTHEVEKDPDYAFWPQETTTEPSWDSIRAGYRYFLMDPDIRKDMESFFANLQEYRVNISKRSDLLQQVVSTHLREVFGPDTREIHFQLAGILPDGGSVVYGGRATMQSCVIKGEHPLSAMKKDAPNYRDPQLEVYVLGKSNQVPAFTANAPNTELRAKFDTMFDDMVREFNSDPLVVEINKQKQGLLNQGYDLKEKLRLKTEEWA